MRAVLDTNVLVSALLTPGSTADRMLRAAVGGMLIPLFDWRILSEYDEVLRRPKFPFRSLDIRILLDALQHEGEEVLALPLPLELPDADDLPFLEVAVAGAAEALVTGNEAHFRPSRGSHRVTIASPAEALRRLAERD